MARGLGCRFYQVNITVEGWCDYESVTASIVCKKFCLEQQQRPESRTVTCTLRVSKYSVHKLCLLVEFMYLVFTRMPGESYRKQLRSLLLCLCDFVLALINSLVC